MKFTSYTNMLFIYIITVQFFAFSLTLVLILLYNIIVYNNIFSRYNISYAHIIIHCKIWIHLHGSRLNFFFFFNLWRKCKLLGSVLYYYICIYYTYLWLVSQFGLHCVILWLPCRLGNRPYQYPTLLYA